MNSLGEVTCDSGNIGKTPVLHFIFKCLFVYLVALGLSCGTQNLHCVTRDLSL